MLPIRAELRVVNAVPVTLEDGEELAALCLPDPRGVVPRCGDDALPIGAEFRSVNGALMALEDGQQYTWLHTLGKLNV